MTSNVECSTTKYDMSYRKVVGTWPGRLHKEKRGGGVAPLRDLADPPSCRIVRDRLQLQEDEDALLLKEVEIFHDFCH